MSSERDISLDKRTAIPPVLTVIARYCAVRPRARCTGTAERQKEDRPPGQISCRPRAIQRYSGKCHGFISMLQGRRERNICSTRVLVQLGLPQIEERDN